MNSRREAGTLFCIPGTGHRAAISENTLRSRCSPAHGGSLVFLSLLCPSELHPGTLPFLSTGAPGQGYRLERQVFP